MAVSQTYFPNARDFTVNGGQFFNISHTNTINNVSDSDPVSTTLWQDVAAGAMFDSAERFPPAKCHPGTRERIIVQIVDWIDSPTPNQRILWLYGPAGSGKSALAHTICERYKERCKGSFFFARGLTDRGKGLKLFPTLAYQLALQFPSMRVALNEALHNDPSLPTKSMEIQLFFLIIQPLLRCTPFQEHSPILIIDGLDECGDDQGLDTQRNIIELISKSIAEHNIPLQFLIASRPESWIRDTFESSPLASITLSLSLRDDIDADDDIGAYLTDEFEKIRVENKKIMGSVTAPWPPTHIVDRFVYEASGQYIYASTILKFVGKSSRYSNPLEQLRILTSPGPHRAIAFSELYRLYETIISAYPRWETMKRVLGGILAHMDATIIENILGVDSTELALVLDALSGLIDIEMHRPLSHYEQMLEPIYGSLNMGTAKITLCHLSFREFLEDETHSGLFHVDVSEIIQDVVRGFFGIITRNIDQKYAIEPHILLNISLATYQHMMSYCASMTESTLEGVVDIDILRQLIITATRSLSRLDPELGMEYCACFLADMYHLDCFLSLINSFGNEENFIELIGIPTIRECRDAALGQKTRFYLLSPYKLERFAVTPKLFSLYKLRTGDMINVDDFFERGFSTIPDLLSTFQQSCHIINVSHSISPRRWCFELVNPNDDLFRAPGVDGDEGWCTRDEWRHESISIMSQHLNMALNTNFRPWDSISAGNFFKSRNSSDIRTAEYFENPANLSILALMTDLSATVRLSTWTKDDLQYHQVFIVSVLCWFNRQLTNTTTVNLLDRHDQNVVPKMRTTVKEIFEGFFLPIYRRSDRSEVSVSLPWPSAESIKLKVLPYPQGWSQENIPYIRDDNLFSYYWRDFHDEVFPRDGEILREQTGTSTISHQRWHPYLASYLLNSLVKNLYRVINPTYSSPLWGMEDPSKSFTYIVECLPYAETTQQNLDSLRAIAYFYTYARLDYDPPMAFWDLSVEFLRKYDRSVLSVEELNELERWLDTMGRWMKHYPRVTPSPQLPWLDTWRRFPRTKSCD